MDETPTHKHPIWFLVGVIAITLIAVLVIREAGESIDSQERQIALDPFYEPPEPTAGDSPGDLIRSEPYPSGSSPGSVSVNGATSHRILYWSETSQGELVASSGMLFVPTADAPEGGREVVAWAHGTVGLGNGCAPSRTDDPLSGLAWIDLMIANNWVVTATDYAGLGTPGTEPYLIGVDESRDVLNSIRAARNFEDSGASTRFAVYGHSQGGHSALWTANEAQSYAPELEHIATAAIAPAAQLEALFGLQYDTLVAWFLGPDVALTWPKQYEDLELEPYLSSAAMGSYEHIALKCIEDAAIEGTVRGELFREHFFDSDPMVDETWTRAATEQTPAPMSSTSKPLFIGESTADKIVLPSTTALYIERSCDAGGSVHTNWLDDTAGLGHAGLGNTFGPAVTTWIQLQFDGGDAQSSCGATLPVKPAMEAQP